MWLTRRNLSHRDKEELHLKSQRKLNLVQFMVNLVNLMRAEELHLALCIWNGELYLEIYMILA